MAYLDMNAKIFVPVFLALCLTAGAVAAFTSYQAEYKHFTCHDVMHGLPLAHQGRPCRSRGGPFGHLFRLV